MRLYAETSRFMWGFEAWDEQGRLWLPATTASTQNPEPVTRWTCLGKLPNRKPPRGLLPRESTP